MFEMTGSDAVCVGLDVRVRSRHIRRVRTGSLGESDQSALPLSGV